MTARPHWGIEPRVTCPFADGEGFADWLDANPELTHAYLDEVKAGEVGETLRDCLLDILQETEVLTALTVAAAHKNLIAMGMLLDTVLTRAIVQAEDYDQLKAREKFDAVVSALESKRNAWFEGGA